MKSRRQYAPSKGGRKPDYDVIVVGASCAGLAAAKFLATRRPAHARSPDEMAGGFDETGRSSCAPAGANVVGCDVGSSVIHETGVMELLANGTRRRVELERPDLVVERGALRRILAREVERAGVEVRLGGRVHEVKVDAGTLAVSVRNGSSARLTTRHLVGADGSRSVVAEAFGARPQRTVPIVQGAWLSGTATIPT